MIEPWMSSADIRAGSRWAAEVGTVLEQSHFGVLSLSRQNLDSSWLHFKAGALSKSLSAGRLVPYLIDLDVRDIQPPLSLFQAVRADQEGTMALVSSIGSLAETGQRTPDQLGRSFQLLWPEMLRHLNKTAWDS